MSLRGFSPTRNEVDTLVLAWLNQMDTVEIDDFFWDYPAPTGYSANGYGIGRATARQIVAHRNNNTNRKFVTLDEVRNIRGVGNDKIADMRIQAREALAVAAYRGKHYEPAQLRKILGNIGPGLPLFRVVEKFKWELSQLLSQQKKGFYVKIIGTASIKIPFVALVPADIGSNETSAYPRVRIEPWAFAAHDKKYFCILEIEQGRFGQAAVSIRR